MGDEDEAQPESNLTWQKYFLKPVQSAEQVIVTEKANGEAAHLSARFIQDQFYLILGSKNVHLVIGKESDLDQYRDGRFKVSSCTFILTGEKFAGTMSLVNMTQCNIENHLFFSQRPKFNNSSINHPF